MTAYMYLPAFKSTITRTKNPPRTIEFLDMPILGTGFPTTQTPSVLRKLVTCVIFVGSIWHIYTGRLEDLNSVDLCVLVVLDHKPLGPKTSMVNVSFGGGRGLDYVCSDLSWKQPKYKIYVFCAFQQRPLQGPVEFSPSSIFQGNQDSYSNILSIAIMSRDLLETKVSQACKCISLICTNGMSRTMNSVRSAIRVKINLKPHSCSHPPISNSEYQGF